MTSLNAVSSHDKNLIHKCFEYYDELQECKAKLAKATSDSEKLEQAKLSIIEKNEEIDACAKTILELEDFIAKKGDVAHTIAGRLLATAKDSNAKSIQLKAMEDKVKSLEQRIKDLMQESFSKSLEIAKIKNDSQIEIQSLKVEIWALEDKIGLKDVELETLKVSTHDVTMESSGKLERLSKTIARLEEQHKEERNKFTKEIESLKSQLRNKDQDQDREIKKLYVKLLQAHNDLFTMSEKCSRWEKAYQNLQKEINTKNGESTNEQQMNCFLQTELDNTNILVKSLKAQLETAYEDFDHLKEEYDQQKEELIVFRAGVLEYDSGFFQRTQSSYLQSNSKENGNPKQHP